MVTTAVRLIKYGFKNFSRNGWLSVATVAVMLLALLLFLGLLIVPYTTLSILDSVKDKIDISVYFQLSAPEDEILRIQKSLEGLEEVKSVEYTSRDKAMENFNAKHKDDAAAQALAELNGNPFLASLSIKANDPGQFSVIDDYVNNDRFDSVVDRVTYAENQMVIDRLTRIVNNVNTGGFALTVILAVIAILVAFNTIWLAMYSNREEISIMRLVGASNMYIRGPYVVEGIIYGLIAAVASMIIAIPAILSVGSWLTRMDAGVNLSGYFFGNFFSLLFYQLFFGVLLGALSSFIAIRRYLKI